MAATGYYIHRDCKLHDMGAGHPECPERIDAIEDRLLMTGVSDVLDRREPQPANLAEIKLAHRRLHIASIRGMSDWLHEDDVAAGAGAIAADERLAFRLRKSGCLIEL